MSNFLVARIALLLVILLGVSPVFSEEAVFFPDRGIVFPDSMESDRTDIGHIFSNPSRIYHHNTAPTIKLENAPAFVGYNQLSVSGLYPLKEVTLFAGYLYFGNNTLEHTTRDSVHNRPISAGSFSHDYQKLTMGGVYHIPKTPLHFSANLEWAGQQLSGESVSGLGFGTGVHWSINSQFWTSLYIHRVVSPSWKWASGHIEKLGPYGILTVGYSADTWHLSVDSDGSLWRSRGTYEIGQYLAIFGDVVSVEWQSMRRMGLGVALQLEPLRIQYTRLLFSDTRTDADHDIFGVSITL